MIVFLKNLLWGSESPIKLSDPTHIEDDFVWVDAKTPAKLDYINVYDDCIDDLVIKYPGVNFMLHRKEVSHFDGTSRDIAIGIIKDFEVVLLKYKEHIYEWHRSTNTVYGLNSSILANFRIKPNFVTRD